MKHELMKFIKNDSWITYIFVSNHDIEKVNNSNEHQFLIIHERVVNCKASHLCIFRMKRSASFPHELSNLRFASWICYQHLKFKYFSGVEKNKSLLVIKQLHICNVLCKKLVRQLIYTTKCVCMETHLQIFAVQPYSVTWFDMKSIRNKGLIKVIKVCIGAVEHQSSCRRQKVVENA